MLDIVDAVRIGRGGFTAEVVGPGWSPDNPGEEIDSFEFRMGAVDKGVRTNRAFSDVKERLRHASDEHARGYAAYGTRKTNRAGTSAHIEAIHDALRVLGEEPPAPKSIETIVARHRKATRHE
jgi:hypothetical protein